MKVEVRYYTRSGNTKKLAEAIAKAVGTEAKTVRSDIFSLLSAITASRRQHRSAISRSRYRHWSVN